MLKQNNENNKPEQLVCNQCHCTSPLVDSFREYEYQVLCPSCIRNRELKRVSQYFWPKIVVLAASLVFAVGFYFLNSSRYLLFIGFFIFVISWVLTLSLYVFAHAITAFLLKGKIYELKIGNEPIAYERKIGRCHFKIGKSFKSSSHVVAFPSKQFLRIKYVLFYLTGILLHGLIVFFLWPSFDRGLYIIRDIFFATNAFLLLSIVLPQKIFSSGRLINNNFLWIMSVLSGEKTIEDLHAIYYFHEGNWAFNLNKIEAADQIWRDGLSLYPDSITLQCQQILSSTKLGKKEDAQDLVEKLLLTIKSVTDPHQEAFILFVFTRYFLQNQMFDRAYDNALKAYYLVPWEPYVGICYGAALIEKGELQKGIDYVFKAHDRYSTDSVGASAFAYAAIGYNRMGNIEKARELYMQARELDLEDEYVILAGSEITLE